MSIKKWSEVGFSHYLMFRLVMENEEICKGFLERVLNLKIKELKFLATEKSLEATLLSRGVRLDVYIVDDHNIAYDLEMQVGDLNSREMAKRCRYYQSLMDGDALKKGEAYASLRRSYIIFVCTFDPFGENRTRYTFSTKCEENYELKFEDECYKIIINTLGDKTGFSQDFVNLLNYINSGTPNDSYTQQIDARVLDLRQDNAAGVMYMQLEQHIMERERKAEEKGFVEGEAKGIEAVAIKMLQNRIPVATIQKCTELTLPQLQELAAKLGVSLVM